MSTSELQSVFQRWVITPLDNLRKLPNGDGAYAALAIAFGLYERFLISTLAAQGRSEEPAERYKFASEDFSNAVTADDFQAFWDMYRVGIQHCFQPKNFTKGKDSTTWGWDISENMGYHAYPTITHTPPSDYTIAIDPWKFVDHVITRWNEHPELLNQKPVFSFGTITVVQPTDTQLSPEPISRSLGQSQQMTSMQINFQPTHTGIPPSNMP